MPPKKGGGGGKKARPLVAPLVSARVRPLASEGGHAESGKPDEKFLKAWDERGVVIGDRHGEQRYDFMHAVVLPEHDQAHLFETSVRASIDIFTRERSVLFFAYGQTGTGKTHTILGPEPSQTSVRHADWGVFPRAVDATLEAMAAAGGAWSLHASAVEFYIFETFDLLDDDATGSPQPILVDRATHRPVGASQHAIRALDDVLPFLAKVRKNRTSASTRMNAAKCGGERARARARVSRMKLRPLPLSPRYGKHAGSSRSHAALILTLRQLDAASGAVRTTTFDCVDLAGAERPSKTGKARETGYDLIVAAFRGEDIRGREGVLINFELSGLRTAVVSATETHRAGKPLVPPGQLETDAIKYLLGRVTRARGGSRARARSLSACVVVGETARAGGPPLAPPRARDALASRSGV